MCKSHGCTASREGCAILVFIQRECWEFTVTSLYVYIQGNWPRCFIHPVTHLPQIIHRQGEILLYDHLKLRKCTVVTADYHAIANEIFDQITLWSIKVWYYTVLVILSQGSYSQGSTFRYRPVATGIQTVSGKSNSKICNLFKHFILIQLPNFYELLS